MFKKVNLSYLRSWFLTLARWFQVRGRGRTTAFPLSVEEREIIRWLRQSIEQKGPGELVFYPKSEQVASRTEATVEAVRANTLGKQGWIPFSQYTEQALADVPCVTGHTVLRNGEVRTYYCDNPKCCPQLEMALYRFNSSQELEIVAGWNPFLAVAMAFEPLLSQTIDIKALPEPYSREEL